MLVRWLREAVITVCGLIALISPVALWVTWSTTSFYVVLTVACSAILIVYLVIMCSPEDER
jgi:hypothetical protein